jgi:hypothetical protein
LFNQRLPGAHPGDYLVRLNRQPAAADELLTEGSRVSITPTKIEGAGDVVAPARRIRETRAVMLPQG